MRHSARHFSHTSCFFAALWLALWALSCFPLKMQANGRLQGVSSSSQSAKTQPAKKSTKTAKKRKTPPTPRTIPLPVPSRSDALVADTLRNDHIVELFTDATAERGVVKLTLREAQEVEIVAFNILGKRVSDIYAGGAKSGMNTVSFDLSTLSDGVYICVVRGRHFKTAQKFIVSR